MVEMGGSENFIENIIQQETIDDIFLNFSEFYAHTSTFFIVIAIIVFLFASIVTLKYIPTLRSLYRSEHFFTNIKRCQFSNFIFLP
uniref:Uncharacterized protein n=1 Tax=Ascaris lumbricoides TaxID=6252 RepID=A0A0M3IJ96_ASCLU